MKIRRSVLPLVAMTAIFAGSCSHNNNEEIVMESYRFDVVTESDTARQGAGKEYIHRRAGGILPRAIGDANIASLRDTLMKMSRVRYDSERGIIPELHSDEKLTDLNPDSVECCADSYSNLALQLCTPEVAVWSCTTSIYNCHAAHGVYATRYINYSFKSHKVLKLSDLMKRGYEKALLALIRERLAENDNLFTEAKEAGMPRQFYIEPDGLTFVYGLYEVAPYSAGEIKVNIGYYELIDVMRSDVMSYLVGD